MFAKIMFLPKSKQLIQPNRMYRSLLVCEEQLSRRSCEIIDVYPQTHRQCLHNLTQLMGKIENTMDKPTKDSPCNGTRLKPARIASRMIVTFQGKQPSIIQTTKKSVYIFYDQNATDIVITAPKYTIIQNYDEAEIRNNTSTVAQIEAPPQKNQVNNYIAPLHIQNVPSQSPFRFVDSPQPRVRRFLAPEGLRDIRCWLTGGKTSLNQSTNATAAAPKPSVPVPAEKEPEVKAATVEKPPKTVETPPKTEESPQQNHQLHLRSNLLKFPKGVLHNMFANLAQQLNNNALKIEPIYTKTREKKGTTGWCCTYNLNWPEPMKFTAVSQTKQDASHQAAVLALSWLKKQERIDASGSPILVDNDQMQQLTKSTMAELRLNPQSVQDMERIIQLHTQEFVPNVGSNVGESRELTPTAKEVKELGFLDKKKLKFLGTNKYFAKQKVDLPIAAHKDQFIDLLRKNQVVIVKGEPGCGKSTRIPQYVLESWITDDDYDNKHCRIAVTQPRRIAAISLAERVSSERGEHTGQIVGYQVRLKNQFSPQTGRILYCTTGILLRHLQSDATLSNFSHVILDEAHERDVNTDLLMNFLRTTIKTNPQLKVIIMSATIDTSMFRAYFDGAPIIHIPGFTYSVKSHFLDTLSTHMDLSKSAKMCETDLPSVVHEDFAQVIRHIHKTQPEGAILCFLPGWEDISKVEKLVPKQQDLCVFCLHSRLQDSDQWRIFCKPPPGVRKIILATNIAETSVTIDDVVYVIDSGIHKENRFDADKGVTCIDNHWISQASAVQRKGRAGRCRPGECYHLYTKAKHDTFDKYTDPEILKSPLTKIVLDSKSYSNDMDALEFMSQLPSPPDKAATRRAVRELKDLQLLDADEKLTPLGRTLSNFQLEPKLAKTMVNSVVYQCVTPIVDIITLFSADSELFMSGLMDKERIKRIKSKACRNSDHLAMMRLFEAWLEAMDEEGEQGARKYCNDAGLAHHKLCTMDKLRQIHFEYLYSGLHDSLPKADTYSDNDELVKSILFSGVGTVLKHRNWDLVKGRYKKSNVFITNYNHRATITSESVNFKRTSFDSPLLVYINEVRSNIRRTTLVRECSEISPVAVLLFANKSIEIQEANTKCEDDVIISLKDTKVEYICKKEVADIIKRCKTVLDVSYEYFISQITEGGDNNRNLNSVWDKMLKNVNAILRRSAV